MTGNSGKSKNTDGGADFFSLQFFLHALEGPGGGMLFRIFLKSKALNDAF